MNKEKSFVALQQMLKMGWKPGKGIGKNLQGRHEPVMVDIRKGKSTGLGYSESQEKNTSEAIVNFLLPFEKLVQASEDGESAVSKKRSRIKLTNPECLNIFEEGEYEENATGSLPTLPEIIIKIGNYEIACLVDTGSQVTCISLECWTEIDPTGTKYPLMPIHTIQLKGAVGTKSKRVTKMVLLPLEIAKEIIETPFLVVDGLIRSIILGYDFLENHQAIIFTKGSPGQILALRSKRIAIGFEDSTVQRKIIQTDFTEETQTQNEEILASTIESNKTPTIEEYVKGLDLSENEKFELRKTLSKYTEVFQDKPGRTQLYQHEIKLIDQKPFTMRAYPVPLAYRDKVSTKLDEMLEQGLIERKSTNYSSPITITLKKDGSVRILLDARELNSKMIGEIETPPIISDIIQRFYGINFITVLDLNNAYFQIPLHPDSEKYTGFTYNGKSFVYKVLPQGLKTSVGSFSRAMDIILGTEVRSFCINYLDDLAIYTTGKLQDHLQQLEQVLYRLQRGGLTCSLIKCHFLKTKVKLLGFDISVEGVTMSEDKVSAIQNFPSPKKPKQLRAFLGLCNYYRRFIARYGEAIKPLCLLLQKTYKWKWGLEQQNNFVKVKQLFLKAVILAHPDPKKQYYLQCDSSGYALGGELYQLDDDNEHHVIGFCSKGLNSAEIKWTVSEKELYAIIYCLKKFETFVRGVKLIIRTDHQSLTFLKTWKLYSAKVTRWILYLDQFDHIIEYVKGSENRGADILSRYSVGTAQQIGDRVIHPEVALFTVKRNREIVEGLRNIKSKQRQDEFLTAISKRIFSGKKDRDPLVERLHQRYCFVRGVLYYKSDTNEESLLALPESLVNEVVKYFHEELGHFGTYKVLTALKGRVYWPRMRRSIQEIIQKCHTCQVSKRETRPMVGESNPVITSRPGEKVMVDYYGPLPTGRGGAAYIFVIQDSFSKYVKLYAMRKATGKAAAKRMLEYARILKPDVVISDRGSQFTSKEWKKILNGNGIKTRHISVRNPRANITERVNKELGRFYRTFCDNNHKKWPNILQQIEDCYNKAVHSSTGYTPREILWGKSTCHKLDKDLLLTPNKGNSVNEIRKKALINLQNQADIRKRSFDKTHRLINYKIGDWVKLKAISKSNKDKGEISKFSRLYEGPYVVGAVPYPNTYTLVYPDTGNIRGNHNAVNLSRYYR